MGRLATRALSRFLFMVMSLGAAAPFGAEDLPKGVVVPRVECQASPGFAYALYLPKAYDPTKPWPVVFCFDPGGRGEYPVRLLVPTAERLGYVLAGSLDSKNGPWEPILKAQEALWKEVAARIHVDPRRAYATGFSGGARAALYLALTHPDRFAGVISCGAVWAERKEVPKKSPLALFLLVGNQDFNLFEFTRAQKELDKKGVRHWFEEWDGDHRWPSNVLLAEGMEYMHASAMKAGFIPEDKAYLEGLLQARLQSAAALAQAGLAVEAFRKYRQTAQFFQGLPGAEKAAAEAEALSQSPEVRGWFDMEGKFEEYHERLNRAQDAQGLTGALKELKAKSKEPGAVGAAAQQLIRMSKLQLHQLTVGFFRQGRYREGAACEEIILDVTPDDPVAAYNLACAYSLMGARKDAVKYLKVAVNSGFKDWASMDKDTDLNNIRKEPGYQEVLAQLKSAQTSPPVPPGG